MKRLIFLLFIGTASLISCEKEYTCNCTADDSSLNASYTETLTRNDADAWCDGWQSSGAGTAGWVCKLSN